MPSPVPYLSALLFAMAAPSVASTADMAGRVDIGGGRMIYIECQGAGTPAVVIIAGVKASAADWTESAASAPNVFSAIGDDTQVCACDYPGTPMGDALSRSDPVPP